MSEVMNYSESRKTQENKDFIKKIDDSLLDDWKIDDIEAKEINDKYKWLKSNIVAITKNELSDFAKWLGLDENSSLWKTLNILKEKVNQPPVAETQPPVAETQPPVAETQPPVAETQPPVVEKQPPVAETQPPVVEKQSESIINKAEVIKYFGIEKADSLISWLQECWLDLFIMLDGYKKYIENNLSWLDKKIVDKIKQSIMIKVWLINWEIEELKTNEQEKYWNLDNFKNNRWILNWQIQDLFEDLNGEILPSAFFLLKYTESDNREKFKTDARSWVEYWSTNWYDKSVEAHISEIEEMFSADLDDEWNFDEWFFSTQDILWTWNERESKILENIWFDKSWITEISLLNEKDKKIESEATKYFMLAIAAQITIEVWPAVAWSVVPVLWTAVWALWWAVIWWTIDVVDMFSDTETLLDLVQWAWLVDPSYRMKKTWVDNVLAWIWLIPWMTVAIKGKKISEFLSKIPKDEVSEWMKKVFSAIITVWDFNKMKKNNRIIEFPEKIANVIWKIRRMESLKWSLPRLKWSHRTDLESLNKILNSWSIWANSNRWVNFWLWKWSWYWDIQLIMKDSVQKLPPADIIPWEKVSWSDNMHYFFGDQASWNGKNVQEYTDIFGDFRDFRVKNNDNPNINVPYLNIWGKNVKDSQLTNTVWIEYVEAIMIPWHVQFLPEYQLIKSKLEKLWIKIIETKTPKSALEYSGLSILNAIPRNKLGWLWTQILDELTKKYPNIDSNEKRVIKYLKDNWKIDKHSNISFQQLKDDYNLEAEKIWLSRWRKQGGGQYENYVSDTNDKIEQQAYFDYLIKKRYEESLEKWLQNAA